MHLSPLVLPGVREALLALAILFARQLFIAILMPHWEVFDLFEGLDSTVVQLAAPVPTID